MGTFLFPSLPFPPLPFPSFPFPPLPFPSLPFLPSFPSFPFPIGVKKSLILIPIPNLARIFHLPTSLCDHPNVFRSAHFPIRPRGKAPKGEGKGKGKEVTMFSAFQHLKTPPKCIISKYNIREICPILTLHLVGHNFIPTYLQLIIMSR